MVGLRGREDFDNRMKTCSGSTDCRVDFGQWIEDSTRGGGDGKGAEEKSLRMYAFKQQPLLLFVFTRQRYSI